MNNLQYLDDIIVINFINRSIFTDGMYIEIVDCRDLQVIRYTFPALQYLQQYKKLRTRIMGCGAVCGSSSSVAENSKQAQTLFSNLFKQIMPNQYLYPVKAIAKFTKQMQLNPHRLQLILTQKLQPKTLLTPWVMEKWKIILFGLDCDRPTYVNCLGYPANALKTKPGAQKQPHEQPSNPKEQNSQQQSQKFELFQHKAFTQIEKDIDRTFPGINFQKKSFTMILKRISNHFPLMGYTQGINFVVGYLLIAGFSESDAFWLFIHMAINRRYMLLGLYEDGFPLIYVFTSIFRSLLKRTNMKLYKHLYQQIVMFQQSAWVFKWFMTCYLSSFPLQMCQYVWDLVLSVGGIGLVKFAISLVTSLQQHLYQYDDACDISQFLSSLRDVQTFNKYVNIRDIIKQSYKVKVTRQDLNQLSEIKTQQGQVSFYAEYFIFRFQEQQTTDLKTLLIVPSQQTSHEANPRNSDSDQLHQSDPILFRKLSARRSTQLLNQWYNKLTRERNQFLETAKENIKRKQITIENFQSSGEVINLHNSQLILPVELQEIPSHHNIQRQSKTSIQQFGSLQGINFPEQKHDFKRESADANQISPSSNKMKGSVNRYVKKTKKQDLMWKDEDEQQQIQQIKDKMMSMEDQFLYEPKDIRFKRKNASHQADDILSQYINPTKPKQTKNRYLLKHTKSLKPQQYTDDNSGTQHNIGNSRLAKVGNSVLSNMSVSNASGRSSTSSYRTVQKQNTINTRQCRCSTKNKTEENQIQTIIAIPRKKVQKLEQPEQLIDHEQSVDQIAIGRKRLNTYQDWMVSSQGPRQNINLQSSNIKQASQISSEVEIIQNNHMFKKKNRINKVNGGNGGIIHPKYHQRMIQHEISQVQSREAPTPGLQESSESFIIGNISSRRSQFGEIESVK